LNCFPLHGWDGLQLTYYIIAEKEKTSSIYKENKLELDTLSDEKKTKIKRFAREYIQGPTSTRERRAASTKFWLQIFFFSTSL
jgi:hypothetical protein